MDLLEEELKAMLIEVLDLEDITPAQIDSESPLFGDGLGLDSIDALELGVALRKRYQIKLEANQPENKQHFASIAALAALVRTQGGRATT